MAERVHRTTHRDHGVVRLVVDYVRCPQCELVVPAHTGPEPLAVVTDEGLTRCGFCKWVFPPGPRMALEVRRPCADCGTTMRAPAGAAVLVCPSCDTWYYNPELSEPDRRRAEAVLQEQRRIAALVDRLLTRADPVVPPLSPEPEHADIAAVPGGASGRGGATALTQVTTPHTTRPAPSGSHPAFPEHHVPQPRSGNVLQLHGRPRAADRGGTVRVGAPMTAAFASAFAHAALECVGPRQRLVLQMRYGLDGRPGRTFGEIGAALDRSASRARALLEEGIRTIVELARQADANRSRQYMSCSIAVHVAAHAARAPLDPDAPARIRAFTDVALPNVTPEVATDLVLRLSGSQVELPRVRHRALCRAVATQPPPISTS